MHRSARLAWLPALLLLPLAACGSGESSTASGSTIKMMSIGSFESPTYSLPQMRTAIQASVDAVNKDGGIDGRKIQMSFCNDKFDPNEATACAQRAVSEHDVAIVGGMTPYTAALAPILKAANIPFIGPGGGDGIAEGTLAPLYPINAGSSAFVIAAGRLAVERGGPNVVVITMDTGSSLESVKLSERGVKAAGGTQSQVHAPNTAADYTPVALKAMDQHPDGIVLTASGDTATRIVTALRDNGFSGPISGPSSMLDPASIKALGSKANGIILAGRGLPASYVKNKMIKKFNDEMHAADPKAPIDDISLNGWLSVRALPGLLDGHEITDGKSVIAALDDIKKPVNLFGIYPNYPGIKNPPEKDFPRVGVFKVQASVVKNGQVVPDGKFFDPLAQ